MYWFHLRLVFFAWQESWGKTLTLDQLERRRWTLADRCFLFLYSRGVNWPYLATCGKVRVLWQLLFSFFGISWVLPSSVRDFVRMMWFLCRKEMKKKLGNNPFVLFFGQFEWREIDDLLKTRNSLTKGWKPWFFVTSYFRPSCI